MCGWTRECFFLLKDDVSQYTFYAILQMYFCMQKQMLILKNDGCIKIFLSLWLLLYWVTQKLLQICTVILRFCIGKVAWFLV